MIALKSSPKLLGIGAAAVAVVALAGCDGLVERIAEPLNVELHEPGKYVGKTDPLLDQSGTSEHQARIAERFERAATDR